MNKDNRKQTCGIVMPISSIDGCDETHWTEVQNILNEAIESAGFEGNLVSNSDEVGIIHKRIIQNLYDNPIVVCDVSCKNPNVMFELGLRLAFDKPTIIVKDSQTAYSFDTSAIEHLEYPRDLRFSQIVSFKEELSEKIKATYEKSQSDKNYTTFLKHFGKFHVAKLESTEVSGDELILEELQEMRKSISILRNMDVTKRRETKDGPIAKPELIEELAKEIRLFVREQGWRGKVKVRENKEELSSVMEKAIIAGLHFRSRKEYQAFFNSVFETMYG